MADRAGELARRARGVAYALPIEAINPIDPELFRSDAPWPYFERLRKEDPVHYARDVDTDHQTFSAEPSIMVGDPDADFTLRMFVALDPPRHDVQRRIASPAFAPQNLGVGAIPKGMRESEPIPPLVRATSASACRLRAPSPSCSRASGARR